MKKCYDYSVKSHLLINLFVDHDPCLGTYHNVYLKFFNNFLYAIYLRE